MIKQLNQKIKKIAFTLAAAGVVAGLGMQKNIVKADTTDQDPKATYDAKMDQDLQDHKNLQAYRNPLIAASLTTPLNQLPAAQLGVSNWDSLPAGTTAKWNMQPDVSKPGRSYGQIIVTFPDGSASNLAVYVTAKDTSSAAQDEQAPVEDEKVPAKSEKDTNKVQSPVIVRDAAPVKESTAKKDQAKESVSSTVEPESESAVVTNETGHASGDSELPQTNAKNTVAVLMMGILTLIASFGLVAKNLIKDRN
ncbi:Rib/alpha-like domain-containing protein [uncultured Lactobacillus sp.]|uniref:Rib/alpha-like domain-containing protein n=1 Tax=uncultured Lactobacillus sp. TaxID=153152 RepID=UPI00262F6F5C|nr:Rib/alpha-like domain-containing protein [uncultured Lactobacillus sp.]